MVAVILALSVGLAAVILAGAASWAIVDQNNSVPDSVVSLLSTGFGAIIGAVSVYLGGAARGQTPTNGTDPDLPL